MFGVQPHVFAVFVVRIHFGKSFHRAIADLLATRRREKVESSDWTGLTVKWRFRYSAQKERPGVLVGLNTKVIARPCVTCTSISVAIYVGYVGYYTCSVHAGPARLLSRSRDDRSSSRVRHSSHSVSLIPHLLHPPNSRESRFRKDRARSKVLARARLEVATGCPRMSARRSGRKFSLLVKLKNIHSGFYLLRKRHNNFFER